SGRAIDIVNDESLPGGRLPIYGHDTRPAAHAGDTARAGLDRSWPGQPKASVKHRDPSDAPDAILTVKHQVGPDSDDKRDSPRPAPRGHGAPYGPALLVRRSAAP